MFLLDTVTLSEFRKIASRRTHPQVQHWFASHTILDFSISVITVQEITTGFLLKQKYDPIQAGFLQAWVERTLVDLNERILPVDLPVAQQGATLHAVRTLPQRDALIAATALVHGLTLVTRNVRDFEGTGVPIFNPWQ